MANFEYHGDDACPKCKGVYVANCAEWPTRPTDKVVCLGCGHEGEIQEFIQTFNELYPDFADEDVED